MGISLRSAWLKYLWNFEGRTSEVKQQHYVIYKSVSVTKYSLPQS